MPQEGCRDPGRRDDRHKQDVRRSGNGDSTARSLESYLNAPQGAIYGFAPRPPSSPIWKGIERSPKTPIPGLYLASAYAGAGGFTGVIRSGASAGGSRDERDTIRSPRVNSAT